MHVCSWAAAAVEERSCGASGTQALLLFMVPLRGRSCSVVHPRFAPVVRGVHAIQQDAPRRGELQAACGGLSRDEARVGACTTWAPSLKALSAKAPLWLLLLAGRMQDGVRDDAKRRGRLCRAIRVREVDYYLLQVHCCTRWPVDQNRSNTRAH